MSIKFDDTLLTNALGKMPARYRKRLIQRYREIKSAFLDGQFDACGLRSGKFCEVLVRFLQYHLSGSSTPFGKKLDNFTIECSRLEQHPHTSGPESFRLLIPRAMNYLYTMRNKRGIGHEAGRLDVNEVDARTCVQLTDWCMCELIRKLHNLPIEDAQDIIDTLTSRQVPEVWEGLGKKRVLSKGLTKKQETLLLLYSDSHTSVLTEDLCSWVEYSSLSDFRRHVLAKLHATRLIEYDRDSDSVTILPPGIEEVETIILAKVRGSKYI